METIHLARLAKSYIFSTIITAIGLCIAFVAGGNIWRGYVSLKLLVLIFSIVGFIILLMIRGDQQRAGLAHVKFDVFIVLGIVVLLGSWVLLPNIRQGLDRVALLLSYLFLFYLFIDVLENGLERRGVINGLLVATGILLFLTALEVYLRYWGWWEAVGKREILPPYPYRFISILGHSNAMMCVVNMCTPLAILQFLNRDSRIGRIGAAFWLITYLMVIPFSSSRSGLVGLLAGFFLMTVWLLMKTGLLPRLIQFGSTNRWFFALIGIFLLGLLTVSAWLVVNFSFHPSHGVTFLGSRLIIWKGVFGVLGVNPWIGVGPGRFGYEYLKHGGSIPPDFWALSAHSLPFQILAEFGVVGEFVFLMLLGSAGFYLWRRCKNARVSEKTRCQAILIGLGVWFVQVLLDDFTDYPGVMIILILMLAWVITSSDSPVERWSAVSGNILILPALMIVGWQWIQVWSYYPMAIGLRDTEQGSWLSAAEKFTISAQRDPNFIFYMTQAGLVHSMAWSQTQQYSNLSIARYFFQRALMMEENVSLLWANLAVLDWYSGDSLSAIQHMTQANTLAPQEPTYLVNLGWFFEKIGDVEQAKHHYLRALRLNTSIASHPFWQLTSLRKEVLNKWISDAKPASLYPQGYWKSAQDALNEGNFNKAKYFIQLSDWVGESQIAVLTLKAKLCEATNQGDQINACYQPLIDKMKTPVLRYRETYFVNTYSIWLYHRKGLSFDLVPGFLQLMPDYGQFEALNRLYQFYSQAGDCARAEETWRILQIALNGGALEPILEMPVCKSP